MALVGADLLAPTLSSRRLAGRVQPRNRLGQRAQQVAEPARSSRQGVALRQNSEMCRPGRAPSTAASTTFGIEPRRSWARIGTSV